MLAIRKVSLEILTADWENYLQHKLLVGGKVGVSEKLPEYPSNS